VSTDERQAVSRTIDFIMAQPTGKLIKESPGVTAVRGEVPKPPAKAQETEGATTRADENVLESKHFMPLIVHDTWVSL
jgi:hypothetical protein